jgi:hypothetical protein
MKLTKRKGFNFFRSYFDVFNELETDKDKVDFINALLNRQFLGLKPTGLTKMAKFAYVSQTNSIDSQVKGYEDKTQTKLNPLEENNYTPSVGGSVGGADGGAQPPCLQVEEEEKEKEKGKDINNTKKHVFNFRKSLIGLGANEELVFEWLKVRKNKKATNSKTAFDNFETEIKKSKYKINEILEVCVIKSWSGFKSSWDLDDSIDNKATSNPHNEELIRFNSNVNPTVFKLPKSQFLKLQEDNKNGGYKYKILA